MYRWDLRGDGHRLWRRGALHHRHLQRGGSPSAYDRVLGTRLGIRAARLALAQQFGKMAALRGTKIVEVELADAVDQMRALDPEIMDEAQEFFK